MRWRERAGSTRSWPACTSTTVSSQYAVPLPAQEQERLDGARVAVGRLRPAWFPYLQENRDVVDVVGAAEKGKLHCVAPADKTRSRCGDVEKLGWDVSGQRSGASR